MNKLKGLLADGDPETLYSLEDEIASGAFGTVYKGLHVATKQPVAIKVCEPTEDETMEDLLIEVSVLKQCSHPNIIHFFGAYKKGNELFIALELCEGGNITEYYEYEQVAFTEMQIAYLLRESLKVRWGRVCVG
eukprot:TRINITY_DN1945_c0_g2_i9.p1 TRINITY_DN1945_c0_g2~~TRINITY_DN1945_c0_g2_i9.p1  ORF type:complete len:134 (+),score=31.01 TRINITY_DN1945_c0_g2_i9:228-629(+)